VTTAAPAIEVEGLVKDYGARRVLAGVNLRVGAGEVVALLGPNGAGKTTLVEILEGYRERDDGRVAVLGTDPATGGRALKARVGLMLQAGGLDPRTTPIDVLRLYAGFHLGARSPEAILGLVGLAAAARTRVRRLSGGERQRLALGLALVGEPEVLLLDEPTAGMDPEARQRTRALISGLRDDGRAILLTTHDLGDVERLADRVAILHGGRILAEGSPGELMAGAADEVTFRLHDESSTEASERLQARLRSPAASSKATVVADADLGGGRLGPSYRITGAGATADVVAEVATWAAREGLLIVELRAGAASLEDRYLALTGDRDVEPAE
jgi:ABC-2 type transport system ATP-binding protein